MHKCRAFWVDGLLPAALGGLAALGFVPWGWYPLALPALVGLAGLWCQTGSLRAAGRGFIFGLSCAALVLAWLIDGLQTQADIEAGQAWLLWAAASAASAGFMALAGLIIGWARRLPPFWHCLLIQPAAVGLVELLRSHLLTGMLDLAWGYISVDMPLAELAPLVGVYGLSMILMAMAGLLWLLLTAALPMRLLALALLASSPLLVWIVPTPAFWSQSAASHLAVVMAYHPNADKLDATQRWTVCQQLLDKPRADLLVCPGAQVWRGTTPEELRLQSLDAILRQQAQVLLLGLNAFDGDQDGDVYHRLRLLGAAPDLEQDAPNLDTRSPMAGLDFLWAAKASNQSVLLDTGAFRMAALLDFDGLLPHHVRQFLPQAHMLVAEAGHGWGQGVAPARQKLQMLRMRAMEYGRPAIYAVRLDGGRILDVYGRVLPNLAPEKTQHISGWLVPRRGMTPYAAYGDWLPGYVSIVILLAGIWGAHGLFGRRHAGQVDNQLRQ